MERRTYLAAVGGGIFTALAGCSAIIGETDDSLLVVYEENELRIGRFSDLFDDE